MYIEKKQIMYVTDKDLRPNIKGTPTVSDIQCSTQDIREVSIVILNGDTILKNRYGTIGKITRF